jgi:hypothetical protein
MPSASHSDPAAEAARARARADVARILATATGLLRAVELAESLGLRAHGGRVTSAPEVRSALWRS